MDAYDIRHVLHAISCLNVSSVHDREQQMLLEVVYGPTVVDLHHHPVRESTQIVTYLCNAVKIDLAIRKL